ncbi:WSC domain-containing protein [Dioszegia hungarica]|uniref:WSC domain-containing protein n=1 Tax=Dioszegia hungarica TaxID=4972 RepID=A0AA38HF82_9TREE|nr:WSC domain-containing protein [Dioszegia hungarica]KAI9637824.1 WSC domain-containing protein [Dioszegia hungarica]
MLFSLLIAIVTIPATLAAANIPSLPTGWSYMGCMLEGTDESFRLLYNDDFTRDSAMTIRLCVDTCANRGMPYAGLQNGDQCFCGTSLAANNPGADSECNSPCSGDSSQPCGGHVSWMTLLRYAAPVPRPVQPAPPPPTPSATTPPPAPATSSPARAPAPAPVSSSSSAAAVAPGPSNPPTPGSSAASNSLTSSSASSVSSGGAPSSLSSGQSTPSASTSSISASGTASSSSSSTAPTPTVQIGQYLSIAPAFSGTGLNTAAAQPSGSGSGSGVNPPAGDRYGNVTIVRPSGPGAVIAPPRLKDQASMVVFGTYMSKGSAVRSGILGIGGSGMAALWTIVVVCVSILVL